MKTRKGFSGSWVGFLAAFVGAACAACGGAPDGSGAGASAASAASNDSGGCPVSDPSEAQDASTGPKACDAGAVTLGYTYDSEPFKSSGDTFELHPAAAADGSYQGYFTGMDGHRFVVTIAEPSGSLLSKDYACGGAAGEPRTSVDAETTLSSGTYQIISDSCTIHLVVTTDPCGSTYASATITGLANVSAYPDFSATFTALVSK